MKSEGMKIQIIGLEKLELLVARMEAAAMVIRELERTKAFYSPRMNALQELQKQMPEPWRTAVCDILANGYHRDLEGIEKCLITDTLQK